VDLALACQWAEHNYPGMPCGIMDQFISVMGQKGHALLLDCKDRSTKAGAAGRSGSAGGDQQYEREARIGGGEYAARRHQCETAVAFIKKSVPAVKSLRDVSLALLEDSRLGMDPVVFRRGKHVITEIKRTTDFAASLEKHEYGKCGELMYGSHESLRDDYAVSCAELDMLVEIAPDRAGGVWGADDGRRVRRAALWRCARRRR